MTKYLSISLNYRVFYNVFLPQQILIIRVESLEYPEGFDWFIWHLMPKGFVLFSLEEPIHIPSVLVGFTDRPDNDLKTSRRLKRARAELIAERIAVVSSAY